MAEEAGDAEKVVVCSRIRKWRSRRRTRCQGYGEDEMCRWLRLLALDPSLLFSLLAYFLALWGKQIDCDFSHLITSQALPQFPCSLASTFSCIRGSEALKYYGTSGCKK